jgi:hypothetical protein
MCGISKDDGCLNLQWNLQTQAKIWRNSSKFEANNAGQNVYWCPAPPSVQPVLSRLCKNSHGYWKSGRKCAFISVHVLVDVFHSLLRQIQECLDVKSELLEHML